MSKILLILIFAVALFAEPNSSEKQQLLEQNQVKIDKINSTLQNGDVWVKKYDDYLTYKKLLIEQEEAKDKLYILKKQNANASDIKNAQKRLDTVKNQLALIEQYKRSALGDLTLIGDLGSRPEVTNPISVFYALSFIQRSVDQISTYRQRIASLDKTIDLVETKKKLLIEKRSLDDNKSGINEQLEQINAMLRDFENEREDFEATINIYETKSHDLVKTLQGEIKAELTKLGIIIFIILVIVATAIISKRFAHKYWSDHHQERLYVASKIISFSAVVLIAITLLVAYSSNVGYMVTILGFASAGIAISLKDWFLSLFGWMTILATGQIKAGSRIKVIGKDGDIMGDVLDISLLKITIYEDVSLLSYEKDKRAGRIIFVPNSYVFTHIILNYNHAGMQTIWESVYIPLSFGSNLDKAIEIAKEVAQKHSKLYSRLAERQMNKMRANYNMPHYGVEPRIFTFAEKGGVVMHVWFLASYVTPMATKSAVSKELIEELRKADDISVIYPMQGMVLQQSDFNNL